MIIPSFKAGIVSALKIQPNKKLYSWGLGGLGRLGLGDTATRSAPVQVGASADWSKISCGRLHTVGTFQ